MTLTFPKRLPPWPSLSPLQPALEAARIVGLFEWDFATDRIIPCLGMSRLFGLPPLSVVEGAGVADFLPALHQEDRPVFANRAGRVRHEVERLTYRLARPQTGRQALFECTFYVPGPHGAPAWACGMLFDQPTKEALSVPSAHSRMETIDRAARLATELHAAASDLGSPTLQTLLDIVLFEVGKTLARELVRPSNTRLN